MPNYNGLWLVPIVATLGLRDPTITGRILSESGKPIAAATVYLARENPDKTITEVEASASAGGEFEFEQAGSLLVVQAPGYLTQFFLPGTEHEITITLRPASAEAALYLPKCAPGPADLLPGFSVGFQHRIVLPRGAAVEVESDVDIRRMTVSLPRSQQAKLIISTGLYAFTYPNYAALLQSTSYSVRKINSGTEEMRGTLKNGNHWRWLVLNSGSLEYYDVPPDIAAVFDRMIEQTCSVESEQP